MRRAIWVILAVGMLGVVYYIFNPDNSAIFPKCPFLFFTGFKCPGCGSQRAIHSLLHFDFYKAIKHNALLVFSLPFIGMLLYAEIMRKRNSQFYLKIHTTKYIWAYFIIVTIWWIGRNVFSV